ncbi:MAG: hypothetical protein GY830_06030, partial [Bacteroidetes bacterium]|nr:hypothetical protein [Bacteroidota bacterium]
TARRLVTIALTQGDSLVRVMRQEVSNLLESIKYPYLSVLHPIDLPIPKASCLFS